ncbi:MAG: ribosome assembly cofactor RimP [Mariprofundaceae bacterium]
MDIESRIGALLAPIAEEMGVEVLRISLGGGGGSQLLRVLVDRRGGVTADELERLSRALSLQLDAEDPIAGSYRLEVSSPGLDWPLETMADFVRWQGEWLRVDLPDGRHAEGRLLDAEADVDGLRFSLEDAQGARQVFRLDETARVRRGIDWRSVSRGRRGRRRD